jgi:hypothetical protein
MVISGSSNMAKVRNPVGVFGLGVITLGIYNIFWWYYINREMRDLGQTRQTAGLGDNPGLSAVAWLGGSLTLVSIVWTIVTTSQRIQRAQRLAGVKPLDGWAAGLLWVFTLGIGGVIYTQSQLNKVWEAPGIASPALYPGAAAPVPAPGPVVPAPGPVPATLDSPVAVPQTGSVNQKDFGAPPPAAGPASEPAPAALPSAGWYPDPRGQATERWWDGREWSVQTRGPALSPASHEKVPPGGSAGTQIN